MQKNTRRLKLDPTPAGLVKSLCKSYPTVWRGIRKQHLKNQKRVCEICGYTNEGKRQIYCHEVYSYPSPDVVRLERIVVLCYLCHDAIHFERTQHFCGATYTNSVANHYRILNGGLSQKQFERDVKKCFQDMIKVRKFYGGPEAKPSMSYGPYQHKVNKYLERKRLRDMEIKLRDMEGDEDGDDRDFEMLPDHECPWATAMWRDCFG